MIKYLDTNGHLVYVCVLYLVDLTRTQECNEAIDIVFLVDGSWSVGGQFNKQLRFVTNVVDDIGGISQNGVHAGLVIISTSPRVQISLDSYSDNRQFKNAVKGVSSDPVRKVFAANYDRGRLLLKGLITQNNIVHHPKPHLHDLQVLSRKASNLQKFMRVCFQFVRTWSEKIGKSSNS